MRVEIKRHGGIRSEQCVTCAQPYQQEQAAAELLTDDGIVLGAICPRCLASGPAGGTAEMMACVERIRQYADMVEQIAAEMGFIPEAEWPRTLEAQA